MKFGSLGLDETYLRHITETARNALRDDVILFTADPVDVAEKGTLSGRELFTTVNFGPDKNVTHAFETQASLNGKRGSPPFSAEFYSGWITRMGEDIQNPDFPLFLQKLDEVLKYNNNTGSVNLYMAHGGTNFGWSIGGQEDPVDGRQNDPVEYTEGKLESSMTWGPVLTSYDYDAPISEAGDYGQPGTGPPQHGPPNKFLVRRTYSMDGFILYRTNVDAAELHAGTTLYVGSKVRDSAVIMADGAYVGSLERDGKLAVVLNNAAERASHANNGEKVTLDILVMQLGRANFPGNNFDLKGLVSDLVLLNKKRLTGWRVFPLPLDNLEGLQLPDVTAEAVAPAAAAAAAPAAWKRAHALLQPAPAVINLAAEDTVKARLANEMEAAARSGEFPAITAVMPSDGGERCPTAPAGNTTASPVPVPDPALDGPTFYRGFFNVDGSLANADGVLPDTYMNVAKSSWAKGVAFINGYNLGYYWPEKGPQNTMYIPGPLLKACNNELILLEVGTKMRANASPKVFFTDKADFSGPPKLATPPAAAPSP
ncbi:hypothetical protein COCSUDRAFT_57119 [Coccomyxa subellipsoidea C-169]|uniref:beta-galactosidase n=1 Tax=Coccomyxa subellipsoidea (strain C-169) TaxID=574566 RepID=I0YS39_COCSC|nr:hypothetical protein COCSUDRAFT_57119 [Coccomyxa subellipsoidea C-169]EIE21208.1 hypothetical protein COCSUDRAFT_57119 [Coccomyxa subellipsoidea C-169]|eukprot:XP_005645752.1 hypothetical protein COCSUDRAFT_57119 [Coccomyxa subellipsoidea C-169]